LRHNEAGHLRVISDTLDFDKIARAVFDQIRIYGASNPDVMLSLLRIIAEIAPALHRATDREVLIQHTQLIGTDAAQIANAADRQRVHQRLLDTLRALAPSDLKEA
jgi:uncharacterized membrane protein